MATAPDAIWQLWYDIQAKCAPSMGAVMSGIVGDVNHSFGFHLAPDELPPDDYSLQTARDRAGARAHPGMASALDVHFNPAGMMAATKRLIASAKDPDDPRLDGLFEFCGTTNGQSPHPYTIDTQTDDASNSQGWDSSHVSHVHMSIHRDVCTNHDAIKGVADVLAGLPYHLEDDMPLSDSDISKIAAAVAEKVWGHPLDRADYDDTTGTHTAGWRLMDGELNARAAATGTPAPTPHPHPKQT